MPDIKTLNASHITKIYNNRPIIKDISFYLNSNEIVGLLGPNGAGKTTCFSVIAGLTRPDSGSIKINNLDITFLPMYKRSRLGIHYLPQEPSIFKGLTVEENIMASLEIYEKDVEKREKILENLLGEFSISHIRYTPAIALSGGERRRVEITRLFTGNPSFGLLDEPLAGIDPVSIDDIKNLILDLKSKGLGILITDHNVKEILDIIDRAYVMYDGKILVEGTPKEIIDNQKVRQIYLGERFNI